MEILQASTTGTEQPAMINFKAAEQARYNLVQLEALFERICDGEVAATIETQEKIIERCNELKDEIRNNSARVVRSWTDELASLNID